MSDPVNKVRSLNHSISDKDKFILLKPYEPLNKKDEFESQLAKLSFLTQKKLVFPLSNNFKQGLSTLMEKNICATLDLSKSLSNFSLEVSKCLELTNITEWNGKVLEEREEKIREIALILAGQCIAILLYNLSQSQLANQTAMDKTRGWWNGSMQKHGYRTRQILTVGNVLVTLKLPYMVKIKSISKTTNKIAIQGFCPRLKWLGMSSSLTPLVWSTVAQYGAITSSFEAACTTLTGWGINLSLKRIERLTYKFGQIGINLRQSKILNRQLKSLAEGNILKGQRVVIAVDGESSRRCRFPSRRTGEPEGWSE